jgi:hypothetical protein
VRYDKPATHEEEKMAGRSRGAASLLYTGKRKIFVRGE